MTRQTTIAVKPLARIEGEGGLSIRLKGGHASDVRFTISEAPRLFEAMLRGRPFAEVPDIVARICGICPMAYMLGASQAMETGLHVAVDPQVYPLRRLAYLGEWIASHSLHVFMLHAPDFFDCADVLALFAKHPEMVRRGLRLKQIGNAIVQRVGGRPVHPVNLRIGGFYRFPARSALLSLRDDLEWALTAASHTVQWTAGFVFPEFDGDHTFLALHHPERYAILEGCLRDSRGHEWPIDDLDRMIRPEQVDHSTALRTRSDDLGVYLVGPLARFNLNFDQLSATARAAARTAGLLPICTNPFKSIVVRSIEILHACQEALNLIEGYVAGAPGDARIDPFAATGTGCSEAPRGICWHRYRLDDAGNVRDARIIPPTAQNQQAIERDLRRFCELHPDLTPERLKWRCEQLVRSHDPCISCACHWIDAHAMNGLPAAKKRNRRRA